MARLYYLLSRALTCSLRPAMLPLSSRTRTTRPLHSPLRPPPPRGRSMPSSLATASWHYVSSTPERRRRALPMLLRRRRARRPSRKGPSELSVQIGIEEALPDDPSILSIAEALQMDVAKAMKLAFELLESSEYKTRDKCISNVNKYDTVEVSLLLCDDDFIQKLNKEWRDEDHATDVLSMSQHIPGLGIPILQLGDIVISIETAQRQAEERGHTLLDEIRILMVHGLLHLLGFDHELGKVAEEEMESGEEYILTTLEWKGKGLIKSAYDSIHDTSHSQNYIEASRDIDETNLREVHQLKLSHIICDIDGIVDNEGHLHEESIESLREAVSRGTNVIMVTGKTRASTIRTFKLLDLEGKDHFISESSPGVFLQGSLVYGMHGQEIYRANLGVDICNEAFLYSLKYSMPLVAYCEEQCLTLFEHPFVDLLHTLHHETKVKVVPSVEDLLGYSSIQKLLFLDNVDGDSSVLRQHWSELTQGRAHVIKAHSDTVEIVPLNASKGGGGLALLYRRLVLLGLDSRQINDPFEGLFAIILLHGLGKGEQSMHLTESWDISEDNS
ncbi:hypothetical protein E2562_023460 [Oryza meyeriana var. granulata]|uniref:Uncharacterized protein n=1 Tax=Oryza meyeriana var. granulata TaxID=110450 RepID=A0A6G1FBJ8_9ORYZ|nr:hypothetical protein E2562_023460 [Oryza meyeriana var. granulata]